MTSKEKLALIKETWYDVDLTDEKYIDFDEEQTFSDLEKDLERLEKQDEMLKLLKKCYYASLVYKTLYMTSYGCDNPQDIRKIGEWLDNEI